MANTHFHTTTYKHQIIDEGLREYMLKIYNHMAVSLSITAFAAFAAVWFKPISYFLFVTDSSGEILGLTGIGIFMVFIPLIISLYMSLRLEHISLETARTLLSIYSLCIGISLAPICLLYTGTSIARTFFICAAVFGAMSIYGYNTKSDLTAPGAFLTMGLLGIIIASVANVFLKSQALYYVESFLGVLIFVGLIAWDTQKIKAIYYRAGNFRAGQKMAIVATLSLYLDFINLFLYLLRFFGVHRRREN